jgi:50S ribosomal protein L16 3-hydroxylase
MKISLGMPVEEFLRDYWQKRPLLIRQAIPNFESPISPDELAGLACEEHVESRIIMEKGGKTPWQLRNGAFTEKDFSRLPQTHWTLLVQEVNRHVPEIADILDLFNFVPSWRVDDLMISYAPQHGSVGPHIDSYDVFLLQAKGLRRWQISREVGEFLPDLDLKILKKFQAEETWILAPGDMLYLPPNVAHHGVALEECMTFSIGFLAPTHTEMLNDYVQNVTAQMDKDLRYTDPELTLPKDNGEITPQTLEKIQQIIRGLSLDNHSINQWFGQFISQSRGGSDYECPEPEFDSVEWLEEYQGAGFMRRAARMMFIRDGENVTLFAEGQAIPLSPSLAFAAPLLSQQRDFPFEELKKPLSENAEFVALLTDLTNQGFFYFYDE